MGHMPHRLVGPMWWNPTWQNAAIKRFNTPAPCKIHANIRSQGWQNTSVRLRMLECTRPRPLYTIVDVSAWKSLHKIRYQTLRPPGVHKIIHKTAQNRGNCTFFGRATRGDNLRQLGWQFSAYGATIKRFNRTICASGRQFSAHFYEIFAGSDKVDIFPPYFGRISVTYTVFWLYSVFGPFFRLKWPG